MHVRKDILWLTAGRAVQALLSIAALRLLTSLLSPAQVGSVFLMLSFGSWFGLSLISPVGNFINRRLHGWHRDGVLRARFKTFNFYVLAVAVLALPLVFSAKVFFGLGSGIPLFHFMAAVCVYVYAVTWNQTTVPALNMLGLRRAFVGYSVLSAALGLGCSVLMASVAGKTASSWLYGQTIGLFAGYLCANLSLKTATAAEVPSPAGVPDRAALSSLWVFAAPLSISALLMWVQTQSYRVIVERVIGPEFLGYLVVGLGIAASLAGVTESIVQQLYFPEFYKKLHGTSQEERRQALSSLAEKAIPVYIVISVFVLSLAPHLARLLVDSRFQTAWKFAAAGAGIELFRMITNIFAVTAHAEMKTSALVKPYAWGGALTVVAVLAASYSGNPAAYIPAAMAAGGLLTLVIMKRGMQKLLDFKMGRVGVLKSLLFSAGFAPALFIGRQENLARGILVVGVFGAYFLFVQWRLISSGRSVTGSAGDPEEAAELEAASFKAEG